MIYFVRSGDVDEIVEDATSPEEALSVALHRAGAKSGGHLRLAWWITVGPTDEAGPETTVYDTVAYASRLGLTPRR